MRSLAYFLAFFRGIIGAALLFFTEFALSAWLTGFSPDNEIARILAQHMGIRDLVLSAGLWYCLRYRQRLWRLWLWAALVCDSTDALISVLYPDIFAPNGNLSNYIACALLITLEGWILTRTAYKAVSD